MVNTVSIANHFHEARFNLIWRFIYSLNILFILLLIVFVFQLNIENIFSFLPAVILNSGCLLYLRKTKKYKPVYWIIGVAGILFPLTTLITITELLHFGDFIWLIVAVLLVYFGLGSSIAKYFAVASCLVVVIYISFFVKINIAELKPLTPIDQVALAMEIIIAFGIIFYITYLYTWLYSVSENKIMAANRELELQNAQVKKQVLVNEILLKEIHHRVKNNMQIISSLMNLQSKAVQDEKALAVLKESQGRIKTMMLLHQRLYQSEQNFSSVNFKTYISDLVFDLERTLQPQHNKSCIKLNIPELEMNIDTAIPLGLIVNEICTNSFKYGLKENGELTLTLSTEQDGRYKLVIADNGPGLPPNFDTEQATSFGFRLIAMLIKQIQAEISSGNENGAKFVILFKPKVKIENHES